MGYTNDSNPFGDSNLTEKFVWKLKHEKEDKKGIVKDPRADSKRKEEIRVRPLCCSRYFSPLTVRSERDRESKEAQRGERAREGRMGRRKGPTPARAGLTIVPRLGDKRR